MAEDSAEIMVSLHRQSLPCHVVERTGTPVSEAYSEGLLLLGVLRLVLTFSEPKVPHLRNERRKDPQGVVLPGQWGAVLCRWDWEDLCLLQVQAKLCPVGGG